jgi:hypothetical protein
MERRKCFIVGGGPSLEGFDFSILKDVDTIAINQAVFDVPNPNYFVTMDYSFLLKSKDISQIQTNKIFILNKVPKYIQESEGRVVDIRYEYTYDLSKFDMIIKSKNSYGLGGNFGTFVHGNNSGFCALQLALLLGYDDIYLLGIDLVSNRGKTHYHNSYGHCADGFEKTLHEYYAGFKLAAGQLGFLFPRVNVFSCSPISLLNQTFSYTSVEDAMKGGR